MINTQQLRNAAQEAGLSICFPEGGEIAVISDGTRMIMFRRNEAEQYVANGNSILPLRAMECEVTQYQSAE